jgi:hypothetical protein
MTITETNPENAPKKKRGKAPDAPESKPDIYTEGSEVVAEHTFVDSVTRVVVVKDLPVAVDRDAITAELLASIDEIASIEEERNQARETYAARLRVAKQGHDEIVQALRDGSRLEPIECVEEHHLGPNTVRLIRKDTGELVSERAMTGPERQTEIAFDAADDGEQPRQHTGDVDGFDDADLAPSEPPGPVGE